jgi:hypothetical protein|nr:MAG TPA: hypothetical protein [Crassvirales sp.]
MEAIKNLRESSALLSNTGIVSYSAFAKAIIYHPCLDSVEDGDVDVSDFENIKVVVENCARYACTDLLVAIDKWAVEDEYRVIFDAMMSYRNGTNDEFFHSEHRDEEPSNNAPEEEQSCDLSATTSNLNDDRSEEEKEDDILFEVEMDGEAERVLTPEEEEAAFDAAFYAQFGGCQCFGAPRTMVLGTSYDSLAECIYSFECATTYVFRKPSDDLDIEEVKYAVLAVADAHEERIGNLLREEAIDADYRALYRELYILLGNDIADIDEEIYLHDAVPYSIEMRDGHRVVCPHFEQTIEADEIKEGAFFDEDFDLILDEETGKVKMVADHTRRLTEEMYEEMERLEVDDNFHASLCEADSLPF